MKRLDDNGGMWQNKNKKLITWLEIINSSLLSVKLISGKEKKRILTVILIDKRFIWN